MGWIKVSGMTLEYVGKLVQARGFEEWAEEQGRSLIDGLAAKQAFSIFGRKRKAKIQAWRSLQNAAESETLSAAIKREVVNYTEIIKIIANKFEPNEFNSSGKTYIIPRFLVNGIFLRMIVSNLKDSHELNQLEGSKLLKDYFFNQLVKEADEAFLNTKPSPKNSLSVGNGWKIVGFDGNYDWHYKKWSGHYSIFQSRGHNISRRIRKEITNQINELKIMLGRLSLEERQEISTNWQNVFLLNKSDDIEVICTHYDDKITF